MPNGTLKLYNKQGNALLVTLDLLGTFNIEDNLNETPSNMKVKVITDNTYREEFEVNTVAYHEDTNTWWVIKSDESTYLMTGEYEHEIQLVEYLEFYAYRHLPNCAFAPNTYDLEDMLNRLFDIAKISVTVTYPSFLDKDKIMPFMSFENYTVANAIKHIARAINAIPKMSVSLSPSYQPQLTFVNRNGLDTAIVNTLNTQFPVAYEKNLNSTDQFTTRSVSNVTNAKSSNLVVAPLSGGFKSVTPDTLVFDLLNSKVFLPSKVDSIEFLRIYFEVELSTVVGTSAPMSSTSINRYLGYYFNKQVLIDALTGFTDANWNAGDITTAIANLPEPLDLFKVLNTGTIDKTNLTDNISFFNKKMIVKSKFDYDSTSVTDTKDRTAYWNPFSNELIMPLSFRNGLEGDNVNYATTFGDHNPGYTLVSKVVGGQTYRLMIRPRYGTTGVFTNFIPADKILIQVGYYPIADIKVTIDNDNNAQDEKYFNQSGKVIDAVSVSKLITSHTNDSVDGTKIRSARYTSLASILPIGQIVRDSLITYVITQRSIDGQIKNGNEYYNVIYTLSRNRVARSENIIADSSVISYKTPDDNLVYRTQLYKDYIELSLTNITPKDTPYLSMSKALLLTESLAGTNFDYTVLAKNEYGNTPTIARYVKSPSVFDLHKAKLMNVNWQDNNVLGYRLDPLTVIIGTTFAQTPIVYTDSLGKATNFEVLFLDRTNLNEAVADYNTPTVIDTAVPFSDLTQVPQSFYDTDVVTDGRYSIRIQENASGGKPYKKDAYEIPVFEYMLQANDDYNSNGNVVVSNNLFSTFTGNFTYHYIISNSTRITAENADKLLSTGGLSSATDRRVIISRPNDTQFNLKLYSSYSGTFNASPITNVGFYAVDWTTLQTKFLFGINDYTMGDNDDITIYINNWKI